MQMLHDLNNACETYRMRINKKKLKTMIIRGKRKRTKLKLEGVGIVYVSGEFQVSRKLYYRGYDLLKRD